VGVERSCEDRGTLVAGCESVVDNPNEPAIRVLKVVPKDAQYWDSSGTVMSYVKMCGGDVQRAAGSGREPEGQPLGSR
jgi:hypothetical protein